MSILIAYNNEDIAKLLTTIIELKYEAQIDIAKNVNLFYEHTNKNAYDIIFIDLLFSQNIFYVIEHFRHRDNGRNIPIALFSSYLTESDYLKAVELNIYYFLAKPFCLEHIYSVLEHALAQKVEKSSSLSNRRRSFRSNKKLIVKYNIKRKDNEDSSYNDAWHLITTEDVSINGLRFNNGSEIAQNDKLELQIALNDLYNKEVVQTTGVVKWTKKNFQNNMTVGVEFCNLDLSDRLKLCSAVY